MARKLEVVITGDASSLSRAFKKADSAAKGFGSGVAKFGKVAAAGFAIAGAAAGAAGVKMIDMASDAAEVQSKMQVVFGKSLPQLTKNLDAFSEATGASRYELREQTADMGALLEPLTANKQAAANMSEQFVKLATDLGSFNNVPVEDALLAIRSGLVGESEPLRRFGVLLNAAAVEAKALEMGLAKNKKELTEQMKVQARAALIMEQTTLAQGDAERTAGSMANQMKRLKNTVSDLGTDIGQVLLPPALRLITWINGFITKMREAGGVGAAFKVALGELAGVAGRMLSSLLTSIRQIDWLAVAAALAEGFRSAIDRMWGGGNSDSSGNPMHRQLDNGIKGAIDGIDWDDIGTRIGDGIRKAVTKAGDIAKALVDAINQATKRINWEQLGRTMGPGLAAMILAAVDSMADPAFWKRNWDLVLSVAIVVFGGTIAKFAGRAAGMFVDDIARALARLSPAVGEAFRGVAIQAVRWFGVGLDKVGAVLGAFAKTVGGWFGKIGKLAVFTVKVLGVQAVINAVSNMAQRVYATMSGLASDMWNIGTSIASNLVNGIVAWFRAKAAWLKEQAQKYIVGPIKWVKDHFGSTPDEWSGYAIGQPLILGIIRGMQVELPKLEGKIGEARDRVKTQLENAGTKWREAFASVAQAMLAAFDDELSRWQSPAEKLLAKMDLSETKKRLTDQIKDARKAVADAIAESEQAVQEAQARLAAAQAAPTLNPEGDAGQQMLDIIEAQKGVAAAIEQGKQARVAAEEALNQALKEKRRFGLEQLAKQQREKHEAEAAVDRIAMEKQLARWEQQWTKLLSKGRLNQQDIINMLKSFKEKYKIRGFELADALRIGIEDATGGVIEAANKLAAEIAKALNVRGTVKTAADSPFGAGGVKGQRALGGPVSMGEAYLVGERGPELFVPGANGTIIPNAVAASSFTPNGGGSNITVNLPNYLGSPQEVAQVIRQELIKIGRRNGDILGGLA